MPQMNPIWWLTLMIFFLTIFMLTNTLIYFHKNYYMVPKHAFNKTKSNNYWKW